MVKSRKPNPNSKHPHFKSSSEQFFEESSSQNPQQSQEQEYQPQKKEESKSKSKSNLSSSNISQPKTKPILKPKSQNHSSSILNLPNFSSKRQKAGRKQDVWKSNERKRYWMFFLESFLEDSRINTSWKFWKQEEIFKKQAEYINQHCFKQTNRQITDKQVKTHDQRQKNDWKREQKTVDILDTAVDKLMKEYVETKPVDMDVFALLMRFKKAMEVKNPKTQFIEEREREREEKREIIQWMKKDIDNQREANKERKDRPMGENSIFSDDDKAY